MAPEIPVLTEIKAHASKAAAKPYALAAGLGLQLEVAPTGSKYWRWKYRFGGKQKRLALGVYPSVSVKRAVELRDEARTLLKTGIDPAAKRKLDKLSVSGVDGNMFELVAAEWMDLQEIADITDSKNRWLLNSFATPYLKGRRMRTITAPEVLSVLRAVEKDWQARNCCAIAREALSGLALRNCNRQSRARSDCRSARCSQTAKNQTPRDDH